jgi:hypothetical protein
MSGIRTTHEGYNLFVQGVQEDARKWGIVTGFEQVGIYSMFYAVWDDKKWFLAREVPFVSGGGDRDARISPDEWMKLQFMMAGELASS